jgi:hypothetical protein
LRSTVLMLLFLALLRDPRAEGATRIRPADLGRLLGLDRAPEVKTLRRQLTELAGCRRGAALQAALARAHAAARPEALGFLQVDGHVRVYAGTRDLPKTHIARMHLAGHATAETWVADADADPVLVVTAPPAASLASELVRLLPELRAVVGPDRRATVVFDRGGWSPATFAAIRAAGLDLLTYRKGAFDRLAETAFTAHAYTDPDGQVHSYRLAETTVELPLSNRAGGSVALRQIHRLADDGTQIPVLTSCTDLPGPSCAGGWPGAGGRRTTSNTPARTSPWTPWTATPTPPTTRPGRCPTRRRRPPRLLSSPPGWGCATPRPDCPRPSLSANLW